MEIELVLTHCVECHCLLTRTWERERGTCDCCEAKWVCLEQEMEQDLADWLVDEDDGLPMSEEVALNIELSSALYR